MTSKEEKRLLKEKEKAIRQAQAAVAKGMKKENWMKHVTVIMDAAIANDKGGLETATALQLEGLQCTAEVQLIPHSITFERLEMHAEDGAIHNIKIKEDVVLVLESAERISGLIKENKLVHHIEGYSRQIPPGHKITLFVTESDKIFKSKRKKADILSFEEGMLDLQLDLNISSYLIKNNTELVDHIRMFSKAVGERPHKLRGNKDLFIGAAKDSLFVDKDGKGYLQVFSTQLQEIRGVNEAIASAISTQYPSPLLLHSFISSSPRDSAVSTLADIAVRRGVGSLANTRRIGPEVAKRVVQYYLSSDPTEQIQ